MICSSCGQPIEEIAVFCRHCGAPVGAPPSAAAGAPIRVHLEAGALALFGFSVLFSLSIPLLFPIPWTISWFCRWFAGELRVGDRGFLEFSGSAVNVWKLVALYVLLISASVGVNRLRIRIGEDASHWLIVADLAIQVLGVIMAWAFTKWFIDHLCLGDRQWRFDGSAWGYLGWSLLMYVSILTVIGWAWAMAGLYNWIADHIQDAGGSFQFVGAGHQILWRTIVMVLFAAPIVTIPWAIRWYYAWIVNQFELTPSTSN